MTMKAAQKTIYEQEVTPAIKRSAMFLFEHEVKKPMPSRQALSNVLRWMEQQKLSPMQKKIIRMLVQEGLTHKEIAYRLNRNPQTIQHHFKRIRQKFGVESMYQMVAIAVALGWVTAPRVVKN